MIIMFLGWLSGFAQNADTLAVRTDSISAAQNIEFLYQLLLERTEDRLSEALELGDGNNEEAYEDLIEDYLFYLENPININGDEVIHLAEIGLLSTFQLEALQKYRRQFGDFLFMDELLMLDGFSEATLLSSISGRVRNQRSLSGQVLEPCSPEASIKSP